MVLKPTLQWDLKLILSVFTRPPLEPLATCSVSHHSMKVTFLLAVTSSGRVNELEARMADLSYTTFPKNVSLRLHPKYIPKVISQFHVHQPIHLPVFFPKPYASNEEKRLHSLVVRWMLAFFLQIYCMFCKAGTWGAIHTFTKHCTLVQASADPAVLNMYETGDSSIKHT